MEIGICSDFIPYVIMAQLCVGCVLVAVGLACKCIAWRIRSNRRGRLVWLSLASCALGVLCDGWIIFENSDARILRSAIMDFSLLCVILAFVLALRGEGAGKVALAGGTVLLILWKIPFCLP